ncbi:MAG: NAD(P)-dependent oxidoreductase, partial [Rickettsiales bacterium]|nr:NAD(P)-dependent oxidoreductase [Rickettsiales bacterium]
MTISEAKRLVIVGGSGFLGQELLRTVGGRAVVLDLVSSKEICTSFVQTDITKSVDFKFFPDDVVVHLAANQYHNYVPKKNRQLFFDSVNVAGIQNILEKMQRDGAKNMIFFSSDMVYGQPRYIPLDEAHPQNPFGFYGKSKVEAEVVCREYRNKGFNITIFRPRIIVGKGRMGILKKLFKLIDMNLPVPMVGSGKNYYQMVSVGDCAKAVVLAIENAIPNREYNLGSRNPPPVRELLKSLIEKSGSHSLLVPTWGPAVKCVLAVLGKIGLEIMFREQYIIADRNYILDTTGVEMELGWISEKDDRDMLFEAYKN